MSQADYLKRLEDKVNRAIEHIEKLTLEKQNLTSQNRQLQESLRDCQRQLSDIRLDSRERASQVRDKLRSILLKANTLDELSQ